MLGAATASPAVADGGVAAAAAAGQAPKYRARLFRQANAYVKQYGLAKRALVVNVGGQKVVRLFVPILDNVQRADFEERFSKGGGAVLWAQGSNSDYYAKLITGPDKHFFRYNPRVGDDAAWTVTPDKNERHTAIGTFTRYIAMELEPEKIAGLEAHFTRFDTMEKWKAARPGCDLRVADKSHGSCMWWMGNAEVGLHQSLWTELGVKRSVAPENLRKRLLHLGNQRVSVVGVPVSSIDAFKTLSERDLLGDVPQTRGANGQNVPEA